MGFAFAQFTLTFLALAPTQAAPIIGASVKREHATAGSNTGKVIFTFTLKKPLTNDADIVIAFPNTFDVSGAAIKPDGVEGSSIDGTVSITSKDDNKVVITRVDATKDSEPDETLTVTLSGIKNPGKPGLSGNIQIATRDSSDVVLDSNGATNFTVTLVAIVADLGSSKSAVYKATYTTDADIKLERVDKIQTKVKINGGTVKKGLGGACKTEREPKLKEENAWSTEYKCYKHVVDIVNAMTSIKKAAGDVISVQLLGTAGLRQSHQKIETLERLKAAIKESVGLSLEEDAGLEVRTLSPKEEAEDEFLTLKSIKDILPAHSGDMAASDELLGFIGLGGESVQFAIETTDASSRDIIIGSESLGQDRAWALLLNDKGEGGDCRIEVVDGKTRPAGDVYENCKSEIKKKFAALEKYPHPQEWQKTKVYVRGGIHYSFDSDYGTADINPTIEDLNRNAQNICNGNHTASDFKRLSYLKYQCFRLTYLAYVAKSFGLDNATQIHVRDEIEYSVPGEVKKIKIKVEWPRAVVLKNMTAKPAVLDAYSDTESLTTAAIKAYESEVVVYEKDFCPPHMHIFSCPYKEKTPDSCEALGKVLEILPKAIKSVEDKEKTPASGGNTVIIVSLIVDTLVLLGGVGFAIWYFAIKQTSGKSRRITSKKSRRS